MGGSFNPAHEGHLHISLEALARLRLDEVWWLVSPQNPLKPRDGMAPQSERVRGARALVCNPSVRIADFETRWGTRFTADTITALLRRFPRARFVWLMGADNLRQIDRWDRWTTIFSRVPVAVFDRSSYSHESLASKAARRFFRRRIAAAGRLASTPPPAWIFMHIWRHPASASAIRRECLERRTHDSES